MVDVHELLTQIDLRALAEAAGAKFRSGNSSNCPLHGGTNPTAFHIYKGNDGISRWHCFTGCQTGGDAISFYTRWRSVDFRTAVAELEAWVGNIRQLPAAPAPAPTPSTSVAFPPGQQWQDRCQEFLRYTQDELWNCEPVLTYLTRYRGLTHKTIGLWGLGWNPADAYDDAAEYGIDGSRIWWPQGIVIPGWRNAALWYVKVRRPLGIDFDECGLGANGRQVINPKAKYMSVRGGAKTLFGESHLAYRKILALTEGEFDTMLLHQVAGDLVDVLTLGGAAGRFAPEDLMILAGYRRIIACHDNDGAGSQARQRLLAQSVRVVDHPPRGHDITDMARTHGPAAVRQWITDGMTHNEPQPAAAVIVLERLDLNSDAGWQVREY